ncbi:MAG: amylo-alpha-1,6-glucosidase [Propionibacteriales bacterium]|nr:amylo-alpha-1,6-glucosidase [Propionibacteriales bacterium]
MSRPGGRTSRLLQPFLHDLMSCVSAPALVLAEPDGQVRRRGVSGWFVDDMRLLDELLLSLDDTDLELVRSAGLGADRQEFVYVARGLGNQRPDPSVFVDRHRVLATERLVERITVSSNATEPVDVVVHLDLVSDLALMSEVKQGHAASVIPAEATVDGLSWSDGRGSLVVSCDPQPDEITAAVGRLTWRASMQQGEQLSLTCTMSPGTAVTQFSAGGPPSWSAATVVSGPDPRLRRVTAQSLGDLRGLLLRDGSDPFLAAGSPWFLTLFGRDSLWGARMLIPWTTELATSTLRTLARRQGVREDERSEEQPGKILHEVRNAQLELGQTSLPPVYYGSVDATPLFVLTLTDAWRWGAEPAEVEALLPAVRRCLTWAMVQSEETGWLRYIDQSGRGLSNQGWKDSHDSVQFADGRLAEAPIALSEVQAYAYEAAIRGARLLDAFGEPPVEGLSSWAETLRKSFASDFWVIDQDGDYPAIALDRYGDRVDAVASNMGHLLGTGILDNAEVDLVTRRLMSPELNSGFGLRTLTAASPRFSRLSYHGGTVWPHDTAIAVIGLAREGRSDDAATLTAGVVTAAEGFGYRLPELYGGDSSADVPFPSAYPAACRPQAWAAAAPLACLVAVTGIDVDAPAGRIAHPAAVSTRLGPFRIDGLRVGRTPFSVSVAADGTVTVDLPGGSDLEVVVCPSV